MSSSLDLSPFTSIAVVEWFDDHEVRSQHPRLVHEALSDDQPPKSETSYTLKQHTCLCYRDRIYTLKCSKPKYSANNTLVYNYVNLH